MTKTNIILTAAVVLLVGLCVYLYMRPNTKITERYQQQTFFKIDSIQKRLDSLQWYVNIYVPPQNTTKWRVDSFYNFKPIMDKDSLLESLNRVSRIKMK